MIIFAADDPLVLDGTYDQEGDKPGERARIGKAHARQQQEEIAMPFRLFDVGKVALTCDAIAHSTEKRKDSTEVKVIQLTLRVQPFDAKLATALHPDVRTTLFRLGNAEPHPHLARVNFTLGVPRQHLDCYATSETKTAQRRLEHVKIDGIYARSEKGLTGYGLVVKATFGPVSDAELGFVEAWRGSMKAVSFEEAEASDLFVDDGAEEEEHEDTKQPALPDPEFETDGAGKPVDAAATREPAREPARHAKPRHADRRSAAKAKQAKSRGRR